MIAYYPPLRGKGHHFVVYFNGGEPCLWMIPNLED